MGRPLILLFFSGREGRSRRRGGAEGESRSLLKGAFGYDDHIDNYGDLLRISDNGKI
jgi:hypothetical protein